MTNSRAKGARGERELANWLKDRGIEARRGQQFHGGGDSPDVVSELPVHIEVKRVERFDLYPSLKQAIADAQGKVPTVWHRKNKEEWVVVLRAEDFVGLLGKAK